MSSRYMQLLRSLLNERPGRNLVFSPFSIFRAMAAVQEGADKKSLTHKQLTDFLGPSAAQDIEKYAVETMEDKQSPIKMTQVILWNTDKAGSVEEEYVAALGTHTKWLHTNDKNKSKAVFKLNKEISALTRGAIPELVSLPSDELDNLAFVLANALYFEAKWFVPFNKRLTKLQTFYSPYEKNKKVSMMRHDEDIRAWHSTSSGTTLVELAYEDAKHIRMGLLLPKESQDKKQWETYSSTLTLTVMEDLAKNLKREDLEIQLPRFEAKEKFNNLQKSLEQSGLTSLFSATDFDFSRATKGSGLYVARVIHQVTFKADESGTVASAATAVVGCQESCFMREKEPIRVVLDRPFIYYIRDIKQAWHPNGLLFLGVKCIA